MESERQINQYRTPYFLIDQDELESIVEELQAAIQLYWKNTIMGYSFKTNSLPWVVEFFRKKRFYAEVVSDDEYNLAMKMDYSKNMIIYNGIIKSKETFLEALENGCIVNLDSEREILWLMDTDTEKHYSVGIRINFDLEQMCPEQSQCGNEGGRFGFCYENGEFARALAAIKQYQNIEVKGIHLHCSSKTRSLDIYRAVSFMACRIKREYQLDLDYVDIGGGFFGGLKDKPHFADYFQCISEILCKEYDKEKTKLIIEPGMSVIGSPVSFVTSVIDVKETNRNLFIVTDGSRNNIDPLMTKTSYFYEIWHSDLDIRSKAVDKQVVVGYTCMEHDRLFELKECRKLQPGDKIVYHKAGAYTMCLSPLFIKYFPDIYVKKGEKYRLVRQRWSEEEYIQNSIRW